ncbi:hypothetical protein LEP1GSC202_3356 [Leptospira yanagawae serovar Saopaulo str. Sao Paulo = ATCC 700523]|uniref:Methyltransferase type 11 domain-containing protein n=1 Tax=Leptospira yanagawae serovar Saopaulo str. Sao Paulo = ATCC 700523 TaxID=1249483 RepID=A0A5E8H9Z8_9LEPT|nr:methyltransferase domain-containing protein [Leptospira yanagawae]EOQ88095.1 hypothetical protein LEP1GSC202_3356 [Leptospira yanagawae serovar Saopaulo str. Sao Paulo = ATCC 700523]
MIIRLRRFLHPFMLHPNLRYWFGFVRFVYFVKIRKKLRTIESENAITNTVSHNLLAFDHIKVDFTMRRMEHLIHAILSVEFLEKHARILVVGPRTENDLMIFKGFGYLNVVGLDLISYSPLIDLGDMHRMPYEASSFDVIVYAWCFTYSKTPKLVISEALRVLKDGGVFAVGFEHWPYSQEVTEAVFGKNDRAISVIPDRVQSTKDIVRLLGKNLDTIFVNYDAPKKMKTLKDRNDLNKKGAFNIMLVASIKK